MGRGGKRGKTSGRGKQSFKSFQTPFTPINLDMIEKVYAAGSTVSPETLITAKVISRQSGRIPPVKILGRGTLSKKLTFSGCSVSASAKAAIEKAGGSVASK